MVRDGNNLVEVDSLEEVDIATLIHRLTIAHKLAIQELFSDCKSSLENEIKEEDNTLRSTLTDVFWINFSQQINENPPKLDLAFDVLNEIKNSLEDLMTPNVRSLRNELRQTLDLNGLREQAENGELDVMYYANFITKLISKICAPIRDDEVAQIKKETNIVTIFKQILELLGRMNNDLREYSLNTIKPNILADNLAYERNTFRQYVQAIGNSLPLTAKWLLKHKESSKTVKESINEAFIDLLTWNDKETYPETFMFDVERLQTLKNNYFQLSITCTILFLILSLIPRQLNSNEELKIYLKNLLLTLLSKSENDYDVKYLLKNISTEVESKITTEIDIKAKLIEETIEKALQVENKVRTLVNTRIKEYLKLSLMVGPNSELPFPSAFILFKLEIESLRLLFNGICRHNILVSVEHYERIMESAECNK